LKSYSETLGEALKDEEKQVEEDSHSPEILRSEFERVLEDLKNGKAPGEDKSSGEVIIELGEKA
jgi:DNA invertase Pin-like site-specific DNA recombinase